MPTEYDYFSSDEQQLPPNHRERAAQVTVATCASVGQTGDTREPVWYDERDTGSIRMFSTREIDCIVVKVKKVGSLDAERLSTIVN
jgi:hypothetical protein